MRIRLFGHFWHLPLVLLWLAESAAAMFSLWAACKIFGIENLNARALHIASSVFGGLIIIAMVGMGLFSRRQRERAAGIALRISVSVIVGGLVAIPMIEFWAGLRLPLAVFAVAIAVASLLIGLVRAIAGRLIVEDIFKRNVLVYGAGSNAARIAQLRRRADQRGFKLVGYVLAPGELAAIPADRIVTPDDSLSAYAQINDVDEIVVAMSDRRRNFPLHELLECRLAGIEITELVTFLERETGKVYLEILSPSWMIFGEGFRRDTLRRYSERLFDVIASLTAIALTFPVMLLTALAIKIEDGPRAPILYAQARVGLNGRIFHVLKFRSMRQDAERDGRPLWAQEDDARVTRVGSFIRKVRIDELPQMLIVLKGDMSFVGPRPERPEFVSWLEETIPYYRERHSVKPGITGWAQLCYPYGASEQDAREKLQYDLFYVKNHGLLFDIAILLQTAEVIVLGKGAR